MGPQGHSLWVRGTGRMTAALYGTHTVLVWDSPGMQRLPLQDLLPSLLVVSVMDFNDVGHIVMTEVIFSPSPPAAQNNK